MTQSGRLTIPISELGMKSLKRADWKAIAEAVGILAIVGSLIFVGVQLQLDRTVAIAEISQSSIESRNEQSFAISQHAEIFAKSNRGEKLNETETLIVNRLIFSINNSATLESSMRRSIGQSGAVPAALVAIFLYENPGVRRIWLVQTDNQLRYMEQLGTSRSANIQFRDAVAENLAKLDSEAK